MLGDPNELKLAQVMAATAEMLSSVVRLLEERGLVGMGEFSIAFERCADTAEKGCSRITLRARIPTLRYPDAAPDSKDPEKKAKERNLATNRNSGWAFGAKGY